MTPREVMAQVASEYGLMLDDILEGGQRRPLMAAREEMMRRLYVAGLTHREIAGLLGIERTTVTHHLNKRTKS